MNLQLHNSWAYEEDDLWKWSAYIKGADIEYVDHVEYILHPTFKKPLRVVTDPSTGFRLDSSGWGTFNLKAIVHLKDGTQQILARTLALKHEPKKGRTDK